jgi:hypothetical protein
LPSDLPFSETSAQGGALWRAGYAPGPRLAPADNVLQHAVYGVLPVQ